MKEMDIALTDHYMDDDAQSVGVSGWMHFIRGMRASLEKFEIDCQSYRLWRLYCESGFFNENSLPNLKSLTLTWYSCIMDLKTMTEISDRLETLILRPATGLKQVMKYVDQIPLSLKKLVLPNFVYEMDDWAFLKKCIARESLIVRYDQLIDIGEAEYLGIFLTKPNFIWKGIAYQNETELTAASALCEKYSIPYGRLQCECYPEPEDMSGPDDDV